jgi:hypothetical protein
MGVARHGFALWAQSATKLWTVLVPAFGAVQLIGVLMITSAVPAGSFVRGNTIYIAGTSDAGLVRAGVVLLILIALVSVFASGVSLRMFAAAEAGESESASGAARFGFARYGSLLWLSLLFAVCIAAGSVLLILPGIYLVVAFSAALPVLVIEDRRGGKALTRARELVKGRWWATLGAILPSIALFVGAELIVGAAVDVNGTVTNLALTQGVANLVLEVLLTPILTATTIAVYADLRARKEGGRVLDLTQPPAVEGGPSAPASPGDIWLS